MQKRLRRIAQSQLDNFFGAKESEVIHVTTDSSGDCTRLKEALVKIAEGGTIYLASGEYHLTEPLLIEKSVRLVGEGSEKTKIKASNTQRNKQFAVKFVGPGFFHVEKIGFEYLGDEPANVVEFLDAELNIVRCSFIGGVHNSDRQICGNGLYLTGNIEGVVRLCKLERNELCGIFVHDKIYQSRPILEKNICRENSTGIAFSGNVAGIALENDCRANQYNGIHMEGNAQPVLEKNICSKILHGNGISCTGRTKGIARWNECIDNGGHGIAVNWYSGPILQENNCSNNVKKGIFKFKQSSPILYNNIL